MKLIKKSVVYYVIFLMSAPQCFAYVYQISVLKKNSLNRAGNFQAVVCFGDYHDKTNSQNEPQRSSLESMIKKSKNGKLIVEDLSSINNNGRNNCCNFIISSEGGILGKLADVIRASSIPVDNVEYRYCRVAAFGPLLKNRNSDPFSFSSSATIGFDILLDEVLREISYLKEYNDGLFLNALYKKTAHHVAQECSLWKTYSQRYKNVAEYCKKMSNKSGGNDLEKMCVFDSALIDMKIMHSIAQSPDKDIIFVVAGGSHIDKIEKMLQTVGYHTIFTTAQGGTPFKSSLEVDDKKNSSKKSPPPIDLKIVESMLN